MGCAFPRISHFARLAATTGAALREESRMQITQSRGSPQEIRGQVTKSRPSLRNVSHMAVVVARAGRPFLISCELSPDDSVNTTKKLFPQE
jgi:hypothetical protein